MPVLHGCHLRRVSFKSALGPIRRRRQHYASSERVIREFCAQCGSTLFWSRSQGEALATLDTPFLPQKQKHVHVESAAPWYTPSNPCPQIDRQLRVDCGPL
ncbi:GFA family protein [Pseudomonas lactucae]|uniref:GFA family protein n=1 Tax=Pseudomonas lactucae TaxID=2813360 RepID=UPI003134536A